MCIWSFGWIFFGFTGVSKGIEVDRNKARAIIMAKLLENKHLQRFLGWVNFLRRFINNCVGKVRSFSPLLKLKSPKDFVWTKEHQQAFEDIQG